MTINTGDIAKTLKPGLDTMWGEYKEAPKLHEAYMNLKDTGEAYVETMEMPGLSLMEQKPESKPISFEDTSQQFDHRTFVATYSKGFVISLEAMEDGKHYPIADRMTRALARSARTTKEQVCADVYNNGFAAGTTYGDGQPFFSTAHPARAGGDQANTFATIKTLSEASVEEYLTQMHEAKDTKGLPIDLSARCLMVPPALAFEATRITESYLQSGTANNDVNAIYAMGLIPKVVTNRYLTSTTAYFLVSEYEDGAALYQRKPISFDRYMDSDTLNLKFYARERYAVSVDDWRGAYGDAGA